ncbi:hypothetical protein [Skermanella pratensis]|uniref:hypothetical protein n=1 Tax=Skermanella pratensis TaxID=2233999 RepID=UPI00130126D7|nr:hypothetical protein [Skermanella pratensis]
MLRLRSVPGDPPSRWSAEIVEGCGEFRSLLLGTGRDRRYIIDFCVVADRPMMLISLTDGTPEAAVYIEAGRVILEDRCRHAAVVEDGMLREEGG